MSHHQIYYVEGNDRRGPITLEQFANMQLPPQTLIWHQGLDNWIAASQAPVTAHLYNHPAPPQPEPTYAPGYNSAQQSGMSAPPRPNTYLVWAILTTIFCCLPFGIVSIVYASRVNDLYSAGRYDEAQEASKNAGRWALWSALASAIVAFLYILMWGVLGIAAFSF